MALTLEQLIRRQTTEFHKLGIDELRRLKPILTKAREDLAADLQKLTARNREDRFTAVTQKRMLAQIDTALAVTAERLGEHVREGATRADNLAIKHVLEQDAIHSQNFGEPQRLRIESIRRLAKDDSLLIDRTQRHTDGWTARARDQVRTTLATHLAKGSNTSDVVNELTKPGGPLEGRRYDAQRLVRTEFCHHYNTQTHQKLREANAEQIALGLKPIKKRLVNILDNRTAADTLAIIALPGNLVRDIDDEFIDPTTGRGFLYPPNRPNDRARIVSFYDTPRERTATAEEQDQATKLADEQEKQGGTGVPPVNRTPRQPRRNAPASAPQESGTGVPPVNRTPRQPRTPNAISTPDNPASPEPPDNPPPPNPPFIIPARQRVRPGVHYQHLNPGPLTHAEARSVIDVWRQADILDLVEQKPVNTLRFQRLIPPPPGIPPGHITWGLYTSGDRIIQIRTHNVPFGQPLRPEVTPVLFHTAHSPLQAYSMMTLHETGHHILSAFGQREDLYDREINRAYNQLSVRLSIRAGQNAREYFCESLVAYVYHTSALRKYDPKGYTMIQESLRWMRRPR